MVGGSVPGSVVGDEHPRSHTVRGTGVIGDSVQGGFDGEEHPPEYRGGVVGGR